MAEEQLFEKIIPKDKISIERRERKKTSEIEANEDDIYEIKQSLENINDKLEEFKKKINQVEEKVESKEEGSFVAGDFGEEKHNLIRTTKKFEDFTKEFNDKLSDIEDTKKLLLYRASKMESLHHDVDEKLEGLDTVLNKLTRFDEIFALADRLENFETEMKRQIENQIATTDFPLSIVEQIKSQILEQRFFILLLLMQTTRKKDSQMKTFTELKRVIDEIKRKNLWDMDKKFLLDEVFTDINMQSPIV